MSSRIPDEISRLAERWADGTITAEERIVFDEWYNSHDVSNYNLAEKYTRDAAFLKEDIRAKIKSNIPEFNSAAKRQRLLPYGLGAAVAAAAVLLLVFLLPRWSNNNLQRAGTMSVSDLRSSHKAELLLSDGNRVALGAEPLTLQRDGAVISSNTSGMITYLPVEGAKGALNTLTTPKGSVFSVVLPDGTHVWLNADSRLSYPSVFKGDERRVSLQGEAYFEVSKKNPANRKTDAFPGEYQRPGLCRGPGNAFQRDGL